MFSALERLKTLAESALLEIHLVRKIDNSSLKSKQQSEGFYMTSCTVLADVGHNMNRPLLKRRYCSVTLLSFSEF